MSKKKKEKKIKSYSSDSEEMYRMLKVMGIVVLALVGFYLIFAIARGEISFGRKKEEKTVEIQNKVILGGNSFSRSESEYYVLLYDFKSKDALLYENVYDLYVADSEHTKNMYLVDLSLDVNKEYLAEDDSKLNISSIETLKVVDGTLISVKDGKGVSFKTGVEDIKKDLFNN